MAWGSPKQSLKLGLGKSQALSEQAMIALQEGEFEGAHRIAALSITYMRLSFQNLTGRTCKFKFLIYFRMSTKKIFFPFSMVEGSIEKIPVLSNSDEMREIFFV